MRFLRVVIGIGALVGLACAGPPKVPGGPAAAQEYHIAPPDVIAVTIRPEPAIERQVTVRPDGYVSLDLLGDVKVEGKTISEIRKDIADRITDYIVAPDVAVDLVASNSRKFYVFGQVHRPGAFPLIGRVAAVQALAQAGDVTILAAGNRSHLVRLEEGDPYVYRVRFDDIIKGGDPTSNYELQPGDVIYVPPGRMARIGFAIQALFFPIQVAFGIAGGVARGVLY